MSTGTGATRTRSAHLAAAPDEPSDSLELPLRRVGKYRILSELGRGGMANVFLAVAQGAGGVNKLAVLKALLPELSSQPDALAMFLDEARLAARLNHPNVVQTYEVGTEGDRHVIVMEYLEGQSLSSVLKRIELAGEKFSLSMYLRVISSALEGLHHAHELTDYDGSPIGLVHRDVSPHNLFLTYDGQVKVLDFGIAKAATSSTHTATGIIKGKIAYMAPEQMIADVVDRRADLYSVGCMLWAAVVGQKLWKDTPDVHIMRRVINAEIPSPQSVNESCDNELNRIVLKAMAWSVDDRYASALELQSDLDRYLESLSENPKPKQIGSYVSSLFADKRTELKALVDRQLALVAEAQGPDDLSYMSVRGTLADLADPRSVSEARRIEEPTASRTTRAPWLLILGALLLLAVLLWAFSGIGARTEAKPVAATSVPLAAPTVAALERATVRLHAAPATARLFLDEQPLTENPISVPLSLDGSPRRLRAEATGYESGEVTFVATRDRRVELNLKPIASAESPSPATSPTKAHTLSVANKGRPATEGSKPAASGKSKPNCDQPFFVDSDGIRKLRPECI